LHLLTSVLLFLPLLGILFVFSLLLSILFFFLQPQLALRELCHLFL